MNRCAGLTVVIHLLLPSAVQAQATTVDWIATVGVARPMQSLPPVPTGNSFTGAYLEQSGVALGVGAELQFPGFPVSFRASALRGTPNLHRGGAEPGDPIMVTPASLTFVSTDVVVPVLRVSALRPFFTVGAGVKLYRFQFSPEDAAGREWLSERVTSSGARLGVGSDVTLGAVSLRVEAVNASSLFEAPDGAGASTRMERTRFQHDLVYSVGLRMRLF
jgi:hypothetical protein